MTTDDQKANRVLSAWNRFWFEPVSAASLGLVRLFFGLAFFWKLTGSFALVRAGTAPIRLRFPRSDVFDVQSLGDGWRMPWPGFEWLPGLSQPTIACLVFTLTVLSVFIVLGLLTRWVTLAAAIITTYLFLLSQWNYHHHMVLFICVLWILALSPSGKRFSLDALAADGLPDNDRMWIMPLRLIQVLVSFIYLCSFISKCDAAWWNGSLLKLYHELGAVHGPYFDTVAGWLGFSTISVLTILAEAFLAFGLLLPQTRRIAFLVGIALHVGIDASMEVSTYGYQMMALYIAFIVPASGTFVVLYDGHCGMCKASRRWARLLDWFGRISWLNFRDERVLAQVPFLPMEEMEKKMHGITVDGRVYAGFEAWRELIARFPLTFPLSFICYIPPVNLIGARLYQYIADRRKLACEVNLPSRTPTAAERSMAAARERVTRQHSPARHTSA